MNKLTKFETANIENLSAVFISQINSTQGLTYILKTLLLEQLDNRAFTNRISESLQATEKSLQDLTYDGQPAYTSNSLSKKITALTCAIRKVFSLAKVEFMDPNDLLEGVPMPMTLSFKGSACCMVVDEKKLSELKGKLALAKLSQLAEQKNIEQAAEKQFEIEKEKERLSLLSPAEKEKEKAEKEKAENDDRLAREKEKAENDDRLAEKEELENSIKFKLGKILLNTSLKGLKADLQSLLETL